MGKGLRSKIKRRNRTEFRNTIGNVRIYKTARKLHLVPLINDPIDRPTYGTIECNQSFLSKG